MDSTASDTTIFADSNDVLAQALHWHQEGRKVVLATVVATWGSSPRPVGSQLAVDNTLRMIGSVSGGCIETSVVHEATAIMKGAPSKLLEFGISDEMAWEVGLACGGKVEVFVEALDADLVAQLQSARGGRHPCAVVTDLTTGQHSLLIDKDFQDNPVLTPDVASLTQERCQQDRSGRLQPDSPLFIQVFQPPLRLLIIGAVHISQTLAPMAQMAGYDVTVIDPRLAWATAARFPSIPLEQTWPDEAMAALQPDRRTAVVALTHDPKLDDPSLEAALRSEAFYIAALGSSRTHAKRLVHLEEQGFTPDNLQRIHGPAGLPISASSPAEIAISVLAEMTAALHGQDTLARHQATKGAA